MPQSFTFIHAADLHLGAPFRGLAGLESAFPGGKLLAEASYKALKRLEELCLERQAAFLLLAGDIYDSSDGLLRARLALRDMFLRLEKAGIMVFLAHGNHDPLERGPSPVRWPENVVVFGAEVSETPVRLGGETVALVRGLSHAGKQETDNLARRFPARGPAMSGGAFRINVLHCALGGRSGGHEPYAPCAEQDLVSGDADYWALGHVHGPQVVRQTPAIVYAGSMQGLHINEEGPHGAYAVTAFADGSSECSFVPLSPALWESCSLDLGALDQPPESLDALEALMIARLGELADGAPAGVEIILARLVLRGRSKLDEALRKPGNREELLRRLRDEAGGFYAAPSEGLALWLKDLQVRTKPLAENGEASARPDLVGEIFRQAAAVSDDDLEALVETTLADLYAAHRLRPALKIPERAELRELLEDAALLASARLEGE